MASKEITRFETYIRGTEKLDVFTINPHSFTAVIHYLQTVFRTRSITHILDSLVKQKQFRLAELLTILYSGHIHVITGGCNKDLKRIGKLWLSVKTFVDSKKDASFSPCYEIMSDALRMEMVKADGKQEAVDRFAICTWFQVQQYEKDQCEKRKSILKNMVAVIPDGLDRTVAEIVYYSKMATTAEFENDIESAKDFASKAKNLSETCEDKTAKILAHYSYFFLHRRLYLRDKSETNRQMVLEQCDIGCDMFPVPDEDGDFEMYCALLFLLYKAGDYLHITYEFEVLDSDTMSPSNIVAAEEVLRSADRYIPISTPRKQLTFKFCMGRLYHLQSEFEMASTYLNETKELMIDGVLNKKEQRNVYRYCEKFDEEHRWKSCLGQDNETAKETAEALIVKQHYCLHQNMLHRILEKFGRKNEVTLRLCEDVCNYIKGKNDKIVHVFPSYTIHFDREVVFVIFVKDFLSKKEEDEIGYTIKQRLVDQFSSEGKDVMSSETTSDDALTLDETKRLKDCINMHATDLMHRHNYLSIITASPVRSKSYGTREFKIQKEPCIVLYVHTKGYIPLDEDPFERRYDGVPMDVREGIFVTYPQQTNIMSS
ncbi:uncharacterized protein LOC123539354 [Mercenaria mercenaria]|uniref:uncharacterized protein LOC123539354 n=1 Tax=Mercenaria mercenaria TaxID=6596 RepID=UPI00234F399E|nr:uncharacterized protein LOC123539354 [Mercenaria mercenaria]